MSREKCSTEGGDSKFTLPLNIAANIGPKTYFTRKGLILLAGLQIDPGFSGALALAVYNSSPRICRREGFREWTRTTSATWSPGA